MASSEQWIDYYKLLGVAKSASEQQIRSAYRQLALKIHPDKNKSADAAEKFKEINKALHILTNKYLKAKYDISYESKVNGKVNNCFYPHFHARFAPQDPPVLHELFVTLEEIYRGCTKKIRICRSCHRDGKVVSFKEVFFDIYVIPGCKNYTTLTFSRAGDRHPFRIPADLVFVIKELPHPNFSRCSNSNHLKYRGTYTIEQAVFGREIEIRLLCGSVIKIALTDEDVQEVFVKCFKGLGFPDSRNPNVKGNLITEFYFQNKENGEWRSRILLLDEIRKHRRFRRYSC